MAIIHVRINISISNGLVRQFVRFLFTKDPNVTQNPSKRKNVNVDEY